MTLKDYLYFEQGPEDSLLGNRFLCRKGMLVIAGPSHVGKSSMSIQQDVLWSLGRPAFGITPARPLNILTFQAENDPGDMHDATAGIIRSLSLSGEEIDKVDAGTRCVSLRTSTGDTFLKELDRQLDEQNGWADLIRLDPLMAFLGDDPANVTALSRFIRGGIGGILEKYNVGGICTHHTTKTTYMDTKKFNPHDWQYCMAGAADLTNFARAVISIAPCSDGKTFCFIAAKRGKRIGWSEGVRKFFAHADKEIFWEEAEEPREAAVISGNKTIGDRQKILELIPAGIELLKSDLLDQGAKAGVGLGNGRELLKDFVKAGVIEEFPKSRAGARPEVWVRRKATVPPVSAPVTSAIPIPEPEPEPDWKPWSSVDDDDIPF